MSESNSSICELNYESLDPILRELYNITKELFSSSPGTNFDKFVSEVNQYIQSNPTNKEMISNVLGVFSITRPKQQELLTKMESAISITHSSMINNFIPIIAIKLPWIIGLDTTKSPIIEFMKNDDFENLQQFVSSKVDFDFTQTFEIEWEKVNLLDICAYYGSIKCFKYLVCNEAPFSQYVCPFSICGGNYEIIHYLENNYKGQNFGSDLCLYMSIAYHQYAITDWLILNYSAKITDIKDAIRSLNFIVFTVYAQKHILLSEELLIAAESGNLPVVQYLCEVQKVNPEATDNERMTALHIACSKGHLAVVQYLCEVAKVNTEAKDYKGRTALHCACSYNELSVVQYLCEVAKVNTEAKNNLGNTPLHCACSYNKLPVVQYLCEVAKVNTEATNEYECTPLHCACFYGKNLAAVQYLCEVAKVNTEGAYENSYGEIREYIKKYL